MLRSADTLSLCSLLCFREDRGILPHTWTHSNIETMKRQMLRLGIQFDWNKVFVVALPPLPSNQLSSFLSGVDYV